MKTSAFYAVLGIGMIAIVAVIWWGAASHVAKPVAPVSQNVTEASTTPPLTGMAIYTNGEYGFSIFYPQKDEATSSFSAYYHLSDSWRIGALPNATGTPIFSIIGYRTQSENTYPRYFDAEVRIGASTNRRELAACTKVGDGELPQPDVTMNGTTWKVFASQEAGMMQYAKSLSYRTVHDGKCIALEQVQAGSSYHDDPASPKDISDADLEQHYSELTPIVQSFSFATP